MEKTNYILNGVGYTALLAAIVEQARHDAKSRKNHLALGTGEMNIEKYINLANEHNCRAVLETKTIDGLKWSVEWLKKNI